MYHPHGLSTADCIMTEKDYENLDGTLAFELAVHTAFGNHLAIVGMSLQDEYLRKQIHKFRSQIDSITWFNSQFGDLEIWANGNLIELYQRMPMRNSINDFSPCECLDVSVRGNCDWSALSPLN